MKADSLHCACEREEDNRRRKENAEPEMHLAGPFQGIGARFSRFNGIGRTKGLVNCCHDIDVGRGGICRCYPSQIRIMAVFEVFLFTACIIRCCPLG